MLNNNIGNVYRLYLLGPFWLNLTQPNFGPFVQITVKVVLVFRVLYSLAVTAKSQIPVVTLYFYTQFRSVCKTLLKVRL